MCRHNPLLDKSISLCFLGVVLTDILHMCTAESMCVRRSLYIWVSLGAAVRWGHRVRPGGPLGLGEGSVDGYCFQGVAATFLMWQLQLPE